MDTGKKWSNIAIVIGLILLVPGILMIISNIKQRNRIQREDQIRQDQEFARLLRIRQDQAFALRNGWQAYQEQQDRGLYEGMPRNTLRVSANQQGRIDQVYRTLKSLNLS